MKRLLCVTTALTLLAPDLAAAQEQPQRPPMARPAPGADRPGRPDMGRPNPGRPNPGRPNPDRPNPGRPNPGTGGPSIQPPRPGRPEIQPPRPGGPGGVRPPRPDRPRPPQPPRPGRPQPPHRPGVGRPPNFRPIHGPVFRYPHGYRYRRWTIGLLLPGLFLSSAYYYDNWAALGVGPPPPGYRWVRYGPDLLLVQIGTRRVADVIYGAFY